MDLEITTLSEISQTEKDKFMWYCLYVVQILKKNGTDELIYNTEMVMDAEYKLLITRKGSGGEG